MGEDIEDLELVQLLNDKYVYHIEKLESCLFGGSSTNGNVSRRSW